MIYKSELYRKAIMIVNDIARINFEYGGKLSQNDIDKMCVNLIINLGIDLCEKQKGKKDNILNTELYL